MIDVPLPVPRPTRIAILGVGNESNGDDGAGVQVVRLLSARLPATPGVLLIDAGTAPENFTAPLRRFKPDLVVEIDAAEQDADPGAVAWLDWRDADGLSASTHTLPPSVLAEFLVADLGCRVEILGIQPKALEPGTPLSAEVASAAARLADALYRWLTTG